MEGQERRRHLRVEIPIKIRVISPSNAIEQAIAKDISPVGLRFESNLGDIKVKDNVEIKIELPGSSRSVHAIARVIWKKNLSDKAGGPCDVGCEFVKIEEDNKNTFLNYLFALLSGQKKKPNGKGE